MTNKEEKKEKGKTNPLCKKVKFTLIVTLHFDNKTSKKLKSHFNSKPDVGGCNLPETKDFVKAYRKLMKEYKDSLPKNSKSKSTTPKIVNRITQIYSTVGEDGCEYCPCTEDNFDCGVKPDAKSANGCCTDGGADGDCKCDFKT
jgi:hypothetical protein